MLYSVDLVRVENYGLSGCVKVWIYIDGLWINTC